MINEIIISFTLPTGRWYGPERIPRGKEYMFFGKSDKTINVDKCFQLSRDTIEYFIRFIDGYLEDYAREVHGTDWFNYAGKDLFGPYNPLEMACFFLFLVDEQILMKFKGITDLDRYKLQYKQRVFSFLLEQNYIDKEYSIADLIRISDERKGVYQLLYLLDSQNFLKQLSASFFHENVITRFVELGFVPKTFEKISKNGLVLQLSRWFAQVLPSLYNNL